MGLRPLAGLCELLTGFLHGMNLRNLSRRHRTPFPVALADVRRRFLAGIFHSARVVYIGSAAFTNTISGGLGELGWIWLFSGVVPVQSVLVFLRPLIRRRIYPPRSIGMAFALVQRTNV